MVVLTRTEVLDVRSLVTVAEISTSARGLAAEVEIDHVAVGLDRKSVVNTDGLQTTLTTRVGRLDEATMSRIRTAVTYALGC